MNTGRVIAESGGIERTLKQEVLEDPLSLVTLGPTALPRARIGMTVGTQHGFGTVKVTASVTYECDQTSDTVERAALYAFNKAVKLVTDGLAILTSEEGK